MMGVPARLKPSQELSNMTIGHYILANRFAVFIGHPENTCEDFQILIGMFWIDGRLIGPVPLEKTAFVAHMMFPEELKANRFLDSEARDAQKDCVSFIKTLTEQRECETLSICQKN